MSSQNQNINHDILFLFSSHPCVPQISDLKYQIHCGKGSTWILRKLPRLSWWKIWSCKTWSILLCNSLGKFVLGKQSQITRVIFQIRFIFPKWLKLCENLAPCFTNVYWLWLCKWVVCAPTGIIRVHSKITFRSVETYPPGLRVFQNTSDIFWVWYKIFKIYS